MDEAALQAKAEALIEESLRGENSGFSAGVSPRGAAAADRDFNRREKGIKSWGGVKLGRVNWVALGWAGLG